jgi:hypothetical protein
MVTQKLEVARLLLKRGADVEHCDGDGTSVLMSIGNRSIIQLLLEDYLTPSKEVSLHLKLPSNLRNRPNIKYNSTF